MNYARHDDIKSNFYSEELHVRSKNERRVSRKISSFTLSGDVYLRIEKIGSLLFTRIKSNSFRTAVM